MLSALHAMKMSRDLLDELVAERTKKNPRFPDLVAEAERRLDIGLALAGRRLKLRLSQTIVAARMGTAASVVSKLEAGGDVKLSTLQRYCAAIGQEFPPKESPAKRAPASRRAAAADAAFKAAYRHVARKPRTALKKLAK
jgi:transcriptional regulator with XRE-family HTH domain